MSHQIEVPSELFAEWLAEGRRQYSEPALIVGFVAEKAAVWAADQQLEECCEWLEKEPYGFVVTGPFLTGRLRAAMRPKPPLLKEQVLAELEEIASAIRRALESIPDADS